VRAIALAFYVFLSLTLLLIPAFLFYQNAFIGRIYPGVKVLNLDLSGLSLSEAKLILEKEFSGYRGYDLSLTFGEKRWELSAGEAGAIIDAEETARLAYSVGREGPFLERLKAQAKALIRGITLRPVVKIDRGRTLTILNRIATELNRSSRDGSLKLGPDLSVLEITPQDGLEVDLEGTLRRIEEKIASMQPGEVEVDVKVLPASVADTSSARAKAEEALRSPLILRFQDRSFGVEPATIASWLKFRQVPTSDSRTRIEIDVDEEAVEAFLQKLAAIINREPRDARFDFDPTTGKLIPIVYSQEGYSLKIEEATEAIRKALIQGQKELELPVEIIKPAVATEDAPKLGIKELVAVGTTVFKGSSPGRVQNIKVASARFHGIVVPPGEIFSFGKYLGPVTAAEGYEESLIIWGEANIPDVGGGICQVSSTLFRAAFWGGYEIVERHPHAFRVRWYEPPLGMDATVYIPWADFKFRNDTPYYILIESEVDEEKGTLTFRFYSTPTGRTVEMEGPFTSNVVPHGPPEYRPDPTLPKGVVKQVEWPVDGVDVEIRRIVREGERIIRRDTFFSRYKPWRAVFLVGTRE